MFSHTTNRTKINTAKSIAALAGILCTALPAAYADTMTPNTGSMAMTATPTDMSAPAPDMASVDYSVLVNPIFTPFDLHRAHAYGLDNTQIAKIMALADWSGWRPEQVLSKVEDGYSLPNIAVAAQISPNKLNNVDDYKDRLTNLEMAYRTTGYARARHMEKVAGWTGTLDNRWGANGDDAATTTSMATISSTTPATSVGSQNIVATAQAAGNFTTLIKLLRQTGLDATLTGTGPYTVFAPTDAAFAKIPTDQLTALLSNNDQLTKVLEYHVIPGKISAADAMAMTSPTSPATVEGQTLNVVTSNGSVMINNATVTTADIQASNGVIHVIDTVLMPPAAMATPGTTDATSSVSAPAATTPATPAPADNSGVIATTPNATSVPMAPGGAAVPPPSPSTPASGTMATPGTTPVAPSPTTPGQSSQQ